MELNIKKRKLNGKVYKKRKNAKKEYYSATYRDIYWKENDKMREDCNKMWNSLNREQKRQLKQILQKNKLN